MCVREIGLDFRGYGFIGEGCELRGKVGEEGSGKVMMENSAEERILGEGIGEGWRGLEEACVCC